MATDNVIVDGRVANDSIEIFPFHAVAIEDCYEYLGVGGFSNDNDSTDDAPLSSVASYERWGLTNTQVQERLHRYGYNQLSKTTQKTLLQRIWNQLANVLVAILVFVSAVSAAQAIRFATVESDRESAITNSIQVALLVSLIMYVSVPFFIYILHRFCFISCHCRNTHILLCIRCVGRI